MKKFFVAMIAMILCVSIAIADCACLTGETKIAMFDILSIDGIECEAEDHDHIVGAYLGTGVKCSEAKVALYRIISRNYELITGKLTKEKIAIIEAYIGNCGCSGCGEDEQPEPTVTPRPTNQPTKKCSHTGGTHENGGKCTKCGKIYQTHTWGSWTTASADAPHKSTCSCGFVFSGKHAFTNGETKNGKVHRTCTICGYTYWGGIYTKQDNDGCGCGCSSCKKNFCNGCACGCGGHG